MTTYTIRFSLAEPSDFEAKTGELGPSARVEVGERVLIVENVAAASEKLAYAKALDLANGLLNALACSLDVGMEIRTEGWSSEHVDSKNIVLHLEPLLMPPSIRMVKEAGDGPRFIDLSRQGVVESVSSDAAAYYRRALSVPDAFDKFRNFYLVAENLGDRIRVKKRLGDLHEQPLLEAALAECFRGRLNALRSAASPALGSIGPDVCAEVAEFLYKSHRCQLAHAKATNAKKVPFQLKDEQAVKEALPLMRFVAKALLDYELKSL